MTEADATAPASNRTEKPSHEEAHRGREHGIKLNRLAAAHEFEGDLIGARQLYTEALAVLESVTLPGDAERDRALEGLGDVAYRLRDYATSSRVRRQLLDERLATRTDADASVGSVLDRLAKTEAAMGNLETAGGLVDRALATFERALGPDAVEVGYVLGNAAVMARRSGDYVKARRLLERALANLEHNLGPEHPHVAGILNNLGGVLDAIGNLEEARRAHERALAIREDTLGPGSVQVAQSLSNLGAIEIREKRPESAVPLLERALAIREEAMDSDAPAIGLTLINLGFALAESGELEPARRALVRSITILDQHPSDAAALLDAVTNLGMVELARGRTEEAAVSFGRARSMAEAIRGHDHPKTAVVLLGEAQVAAARGEIGIALGLTLEAERVVRRHLELTAAALSEREALIFAAQQRHALNVALSLVLVNRLEDPALLLSVWDSLVRSRALVLEEMKRRRLQSAGEQKPGTLHAARRVAASRLSRLMLDKRQPGSELELASAREELERVERALGESSPAFARIQGTARIGFEEVAANLPPGACLAAFARFERVSIEGTTLLESNAEPTYLAMVLDRKRRISVHEIGSATVVEGLVDRWRDAASRTASPDAEVQCAGELLRQTAWDQVAAACGDVDRIFVVPDGELALLSFAALPTGSGGFLVEEGPLLAILGTERDLVPNPLKPRAGPCLLAIGAPDFDGDHGHSAGSRNRPAGEAGEASISSTSARLGRPFPPLPGTAVETARAAALWADAGAGFTSLRLIGPEATESAFTTLAPAFRVLHIATHGFFFEGVPTSEPGTVVRGVGGLVADSPFPADTGEVTPLRLSTLVLAGANRESGDTTDDGLLTAEEIATLDLSGVEWAVLSACESGIGEASTSEGVFGLRRAFRMAGAGTVIMSLWPVEDEAALTWMTALYKARLGDGCSTAEAVRRASLEVLAARRARGDSTHPRHWAAFVAAGDWR